ncbi:MAG: hypothetical protein ACKVUS_08280 [Saprospiraceae bacterium]
MQWQLAVGSGSGSWQWQLAVAVGSGSWQLAVGSWQLAVGKNGAFRLMRNAPFRLKFNFPKV